jgi:hypothetical protein
VQRPLIARIVETLAGLNDAPKKLDGDVRCGRRGPQWCRGVRKFDVSAHEKAQ